MEKGKAIIFIIANMKRCACVSSECIQLDCHTFSQSFTHNINQIIPKLIDVMTCSFPCVTFHIHCRSQMSYTIRNWNCISAVYNPWPSDPQKSDVLLSVTETYSCYSPNRRAVASQSSSLLRGGGWLRCRLWTAVVSRIGRAEDRQHPGEKLQSWWYWDRRQGPKRR